MSVAFSLRKGPVKSQDFVVAFRMHSHDTSDQLKEAILQSLASMDRWVIRDIDGKTFQILFETDQKLLRMLFHLEKPKEPFYYDGLFIVGDYLPDEQPMLVSDDLLSTFRRDQFNHLVEQMVVNAITPQLMKKLWDQSPTNQMYQYRQNRWMQNPKQMSTDQKQQSSILIAGKYKSQSIQSVWDMDQSYVRWIAGYTGWLLPNKQPETVEQKQSYRSWLSPNAVMEAKRLLHGNCLACFTRLESTSVTHCDVCLQEVLLHN